jgi:glutamate-ammonia-ligase adenylyltransferase
MLVVSLDGFADYQRKEAWTWEHMALTRARPVYGSAEGRSEAAGIIAEILRSPHDPDKLVADAVRMREEIARHKPASGPLDVKLGPGGLVDLEFAVQVLQLAHKMGLDPRLETAVAELTEAGFLATNVAKAQELLTEMLVAIRLLAPEAANPTEESCELMARACGAGSWNELLALHDEARACVLALWDKVKEGRLE